MTIRLYIRVNNEQWLHYIAYKEFGSNPNLELTVDPFLKLHVILEYHSTSTYIYIHTQ